MIDNDAALQYTGAISHGRDKFRQRPTGCLLYTGGLLAPLIATVANRSPSLSLSLSLSCVPHQWIATPSTPPTCPLLSFTPPPARGSAPLPPGSIRTLEPDKLLQRSLPHIALVVFVVVVRITLAVVVVVAVASLPGMARVVAVRGMVHAPVLVLSRVSVAVLVALVVVRVPLRVVDVLRLVLVLGRGVSVLVARLRVSGLAFTFSLGCP